MGRDEDTNEPHGQGRGVDPPAAPGQFPACRVLLLGCSCGLARRASGRCSAFDAGLFLCGGCGLACSHPGRDPFSAAGSPPRRAPVRLLYFALLPSSLLASLFISSEWGRPRSGARPAMLSRPGCPCSGAASTPRRTKAEVITVIRCIQCLHLRAEVYIDSGKSYNIHDSDFYLSLLEPLSTRESLGDLYRHSPAIVFAVLAMNLSIPFVGC